MLNKLGKYAIVIGSGVIAVLLILEGKTTEGLGILAAAMSRGFPGRSANE